MTLRCTIHVAGRGNLFMVDLAELYACGLRDRGLDVRVAVDALPASDRDRVDLILAPHEFFEVGPDLAPSDQVEIAKRSAVLTTEQPGTEWFHESLRFASTAAATLDISPTGVEALRAAGVDALDAPVGYHPSIDAWGGPDGGGDSGRSSARRFDATFLGSATPRRLEALSGLAEVLHHRTSRLLLHDPRRPVTDESPWFVAGRRRCELLADTKVLLNVHRSEDSYFEWFRAIEAISNGAVLLSEPSEGQDPLVPFTHLIASEVDLMAAHLTALLTDDGVREEMAREAYDLLVTELLLVDRLDPLVEVIADLAGSRSTWSARTLPPAPQRPTASVPPPASEADRTRATIKNLLLGQIRLERRLDHAEGAERHGSADHVETVATPGWRHARAQVSVIIPVFRYGHIVIEAVESALESEGVEVEVIVVEDHSADGTREVIEDFMAARPDAPVLALFRGANHGLGAARNLGIGSARTDRCFLLDADNSVRPSALAKLSAALDDDPSAAFAYSIIEVHGSERTLLSYLPWSVPTMLDQAYIDAMAMVRRSAWEQVGGYLEGTEATLYGWEDYAFWLSLADAGAHGAWVPEPLCRYLRHPTSMISVTNLDPLTPRHHLRRMFPRLGWPS